MAMTNFNQATDLQFQIAQISVLENILSHTLQYRYNDTIHKQQYHSNPGANNNIAGLIHIKLKSHEILFVPNIQFSWWILPNLALTTQVKKQ